MAALLRSDAKELEVRDLDEIGTYTMLIRYHVAHARISYTEIMGDNAPPPGISQRERYTALAHAICVPIERLRTTLTTRERRHAGTMQGPRPSDQNG